MSYVLGGEKFAWMVRLQNVPVGGLKWIKITSQFHEDFRKNHD